MAIGMGNDGSFVEDIETITGVAPKDIDVVTFFKAIVDPVVENAILTTFPEFASKVAAKHRYEIDHNIINLGRGPIFLVDATAFWFQLFSHSRRGIWKGVLHLPLNTPSQDTNALTYLNSLP